MTGETASFETRSEQQEEEMPRSEDWDAGELPPILRIGNPLPAAPRRKGRPSLELHLGHLEREERMISESGMQASPTPPNEVLSQWPTDSPVTSHAEPSAEIAPLAQTQNHEQAGNLIESNGPSRQERAMSDPLRGLESWIPWSERPVTFAGPPLPPKIPLTETSPSPAKVEKRMSIPRKPVGSPPGNTSNRQSGRNSITGMVPRRGTNPNIPSYIQSPEWNSDIMHYEGGLGGRYVAFRRGYNDNNARQQRIRSISISSESHPPRTLPAIISRNTTDRPHSFPPQLLHHPSPAQYERSLRHQSSPAQLLVPPLLQGRGSESHPSRILPATTNRAEANRPHSFPPQLPHHPSPAQYERSLRLSYQSSPAQLLAPPQALLQEHGSPAEERQREPRDAIIVINGEVQEPPHSNGMNSGVSDHSWLRRMRRRRLWTFAFIFVVSIVIIVLIPTLISLHNQGVL